MRTCLWKLCPASPHLAPWAVLLAGLLVTEATRISAGSTGTLLPAGPPPQRLVPRPTCLWRPTATPSVGVTLCPHCPPSWWTTWTLMHMTASLEVGLQTWGPGQREAPSPQSSGGHTAFLLWVLPKVISSCDLPESRAHVWLTAVWPTQHPPGTQAGLWVVERVVAPPRHEISHQGHRDTFWNQ